jgi:cellobiose phosphorylase
LARNLLEKSDWMMRHIRRSEWLKEGFFNGYYDNDKKRVEGRRAGSIRMTLTGQVFPIMSGAADEKQISSILKSVNKFLFDRKLGGYRLNTDFGQEQHNLGRAFSFIYGDKENGAVFNHMVVMYAFALYKRGFVQEAWKVFSSIYKMAVNTEISKIYPCLPEYFDGEGRGMYSYLTGSASWFMMTLLTEAFGIKGRDGDLVIEPKLASEQFRHSQTIALSRVFAGRKLRISFCNPEKLDYGRYKIKSATIGCKEVTVSDPKRLVLSRKTILTSPLNRIISISIALG